MKIVAKALLKDADNNLLVLTRGLTHPNFPGHLDLPGGEVESNESWEVATSREIQEETGIKIEPNELAVLFEKRYKNLIHVLFMVNFNESRPSINLSWEHSDYKWLSLNDLLEKTLPKGTDRYFLDVIEYLKNKIRSNCT